MTPARLRNPVGCQSRLSRASGGFSLIEVLVSVIMVSVGALSVASLQLVSTRAVRDASQRLEATQLAHALLERLNANNSQAALQKYVSAAAPFLGMGRISGPDQPLPASTCVDSSPCTPEQLAQFDLWLWERLLDGTAEQLNGTETGGILFPTVCLAPPATGAGLPGNYTLVLSFRGAAALPANSAVTCGAGAVFTDGSRLYGDQDQYRRSIVVQAYITPTVPK